ncbi:DUF7687 domain-containing protein [Deinococcus arenicola]|uniref:Uncharacterized protein n=1 Tax=Deinococcus arenicola TaxID=2994950 RepID=A0ABU4DUM9_9DEIO|nr:hypothetical protein [Deinococcus sp. ZS9-10]MDV6376148.1 hypothetical protein [Deinococcus sp. ZS9-10]
MQPDSRFTGKSLSFWADVKKISEACGYTVKPVPPATGRIRVHTLAEIAAGYIKLNLDWSHLATLVGTTYSPTPYGQDVLDYLAHRAAALASAPALLMDASQAKIEFDAMKATKAAWNCPFPMNKQKGALMRQPAYLTGLVNMILEHNLGGLSVNYNPTTLTAVTRNRRPLRTMSRRVDGAFPRPVNPTAIWEIKEYYYTTTFGSRIADGVYETLLDGMEIQEMSIAEGVKIHHCLIVDARDTWWSTGGRPYLCRMVDMLHMGYADEVMFGREILTQLPVLVHQWIADHAANVLLHPGDILPA